MTGTQVENTEGKSTGHHPTGRGELQVGEDRYRSWEYRREIYVAALSRGKGVQEGDAKYISGEYSKEIYENIIPREVEEYRYTVGEISTGVGSKEGKS
jgi:hypothetical protein